MSDEKIAVSFGKFFTCLRKSSSGEKKISDEAVRAVREEVGVMGAFVTAEQPRPNFLHTMIIFSDAAAAQKYFSSRAYKNFRGQVDSLIDVEQVIDYQPTKIILSEKF